MGIPEQLAELRQQLAELQAWKEAVEKVWPQIKEQTNEPG